MPSFVNTAERAKVEPSGLPKYNVRVVVSLTSATVEPPVDVVSYIVTRKTVPISFTCACSTNAILNPPVNYTQKNENKRLLRRI